MHIVTVGRMMGRSGGSWIASEMAWDHLGTDGRSHGEASPQDDEAVIEGVEPLIEKFSQARTLASVPRVGTVHVVQREVGKDAETGEHHGDGARTREGTKPE